MSVRLIMQRLMIKFMLFCSFFFFIQEASMSTPGNTRDALSDITNVTCMLLIIGCFF